MKPEIWWKNFALGIEIDVSGTFIYNGAKALDSLEILNHSVDIFEIMYHFSVGIERLLKVAIILLEHNDETDIEELEKSLITHNTIELANRLNDHKDLKISDMHREFLSILSLFYKSHRYGRFTFSSVPDINEEKRLFLEFISKHLKLKIAIENEYVRIPNSDQIKRFIGKIVKKISHNVFHIIGKRAHELNIYTDEIRGDSKALKVFWGERLDFIDEKIKRKELLLFLMNPEVKSKHLDSCRTLEVLPLDPETTPTYIKALFEDEALSLVEGEIDELYTDVSGVKERLEFLSIIDNDNIHILSN